MNNRIGDGLLFTFPTVTDAVKCGIKIQKETKEVEDLNLRIGIHEGEITLKNGDVLGDDVNVASRIDPYAAEGGIVISGKVQQNISSLPEFETKFISQPSLKGVKQDVKIFCIVSHGLPETDVTKVTAKLEKDVKKLGVNQKSIMATIGIFNTFASSKAFFSLFVSNIIMASGIPFIPPVAYLAFKCSAMSSIKSSFSSTHLPSAFTPPFQPIASAR